MTKRTVEQYHRDVISGAERGAGATLLRGALLAAEPVYAGITWARNLLYDFQILPSHRALRPVVSVGNITTGGTGKTPVVRWLAEKLRTDGKRPAVLLRGYKSNPQGVSDEQRMLERLLNRAENASPVIVVADPNRVEAARGVVQVNPIVDVFILDDGFQHRKLQRDFDLVLIDATNPFGFNHVLPRGLRREPLRGLVRAHAFLITRADAGDVALAEGVVRQYGLNAPVYRCRHVLTGLLDADDSLKNFDEFMRKKAFAFCGIGNPDAFTQQLKSSGLELVGSHWFGDHHHYEPRELQMLRDRCRELGAPMLVTTQKDWVKLEPLVKQMSDLPPIYRAELAIQFMEDDEAKLLEQINRAIGPSSRVGLSSASPSATAQT